MKLQGIKHICILVVIGLFLSPLYAYARPRKRHFLGDKTWKEGKEDRRSKIYQQLDLSPEQAEQLEALRNTHREMGKQFRNNIKAKKGELKKELRKQELDMEKINQLHSELKMMLGQREDDRLKEILEARKILTSEQLEKFLELRENFRRKSNKSKSKYRNRKR